MSLLYTIYQYNAIQYMAYLPFATFLDPPLLLLVIMLMTIIFMTVSKLKKIRTRSKNTFFPKTLVVGALAHDLLEPSLIIR